MTSLLLNGCNDMATVDPRTMLHTSDLDPEDFAIKSGLIVSKQGFAGPYEITEGTIADYENQSGKPELVWLGGTEADPTCAWVVWPDDTAVKIKYPTPNEAGFCQQVIDCLAADLALGAGELDQFRIPEMVGPTWRVVSVEWIEEDGDEVSTDFSTDIGTDLASLIVALNDSDNLPEGWTWEILTGALCLTVPHETNIIQVILEGGAEVDFNGVPTVEGSPPSTLGNQIEITQVITGNGAAAGSAHDTEDEIEAQFSLVQNVTVRWVDAYTIKRISYKDPVNGWNHSTEGIGIWPTSPAVAEDLTDVYTHANIKTFAVLYDTGVDKFLLLKTPSDWTTK
jgi:hypothetical protein